MSDNRVLPRPLFSPDNSEALSIGFLTLHVLHNTSPETLFPQIGESLLLQAEQIGFRPKGIF